MGRSARKERGNRESERGHRAAGGPLTARRSSTAVREVRAGLVDAKERSARRAVWPAKVKKAAAYIDGNFGRSVCLGEIADLVGMDKCSFCRLFKKETEPTFTQYLNRVRLEEARKLLLSSHFYVFQVAHKVGFRSANYFGILFRKYYGCSPRDFRNGLRPYLK